MEENMNEIKDLIKQRLELRDRIRITHPTDNDKAFYELAINEIELYEAIEGVPEYNGISELLELKRVCDGRIDHKLRGLIGG
jgi:hypothetical protein